MMPSVHLPTSDCKHQHGGALLVMLVIVVMGIATVFVTSLSGFGIRNKRDAVTSEALSIAKEALIGRAVSDGNLPGSLPCPDLITNNPGSNVPNDGVADLLPGNDCPSYIGRLPWKTLGISDLRDGNGERLWYALTPAFRDQTSTPHTLNSDTMGALSLSGNVSENNLVAIVFAPGAALSNQQRTAANENIYSHYLESVITPATSFQVLAPNDHSSGDYTYNDQLIFLTHDSLMQTVEKRIAGEVRACLDSYALVSGNKYPWAARVSDTAGYYGYKDTRFGRIALSRLNTLTSNPSFLSFMNKVDAVQIALNTYISNPNQTNLNSLRDVGDTLKDAFQPSGFPYWAYYFAHSAGDRAKDLSSNPAYVTQSDLDGIQSRLTSSYSSMDNAGLIDGSMRATWTCPLLASSGTYWNSWKNLVFYQVSSRFDPDSPATACYSDCLTINGSGSYRAVVALGRNMLTSQNPRDVHTTNDYLEGDNQLNKSDSSSTLVFETYKPGEPTFSTINDLVIGATAQ